MEPPAHEVCVHVHESTAATAHYCLIRHKHIVGKRGLDSGVNDGFFTVCYIVEPNHTVEPKMLCNGLYSELYKNKIR